MTIFSSIAEYIILEIIGLILFILNIFGLMKKRKEIQINNETKENIEQKKMDIPSNIREQIVRIILKILYKEKSVKSLKLITDKALDLAIKERITISEKYIRIIINQMDKDNSIQFIQNDGWKIKI